jgi:hypothetical protein
LCKPIVAGLDWSRDSPIIIDQVDAYSRGQRMPDAILRPLAGRKRAVERDAHVRPGFNHLPVARRPRDVAQALSVGEVRFGLDGEVPACLSESVVYARRSTMDDHQVIAVAGD